ncbi:terminase gpA endonuclease subunit [Desulforegula conservatrix]|uniref:terminase gpA endonuclease subunit n=1 Tax=Desulforegula conservatrix TaxID=153026 RepID=UPI0012EB7692|nr:terminase gpA endonuclease subunit [Desulforegula conservatrix]
MRGHETRQMTAEFVNEKGIWECPGGRANHAWDCSALCLVAADILGIQYWEKPDEDELIEKPEKKKPAQSERRQRW